jgi:thiosulfate dehydrogenase (quinone) large subunit
LRTKSATLVDVATAGGSKTQFKQFLDRGITGRGATMMNLDPALNDPRRGVDDPYARIGLAIVRLTIGAMFVWVFFENLGKGAYTPAGYAGVINYYIKWSHSPTAWKAIMGFMASHAAMAAPMQAMTEISLGVLLVIGLLTRPVAFVAFGFLASLWVSEWGTTWIWELLVPVLASLALAVGGAGRTWGVDSFFARRRPTSLWW